MPCVLRSSLTYRIKGRGKEDWEGVRGLLVRCWCFDLKRRKERGEITRRHIKDEVVKGSRSLIVLFLGLSMSSGEQNRSRDHVGVRGSYWALELVEVVR